MLKRQIISHRHPCYNLYRYPLFLVLLIVSNCGFETFEYDQNYFKGMNIFFQNNSRNVYNQEEYLQNLQVMRSIGINSIFLTTFHYCADQYADSIKTTSETINDSVLSEIIQTTLQEGFRVILKPHIDLENGKPRYLIEPSDKEKWLIFYMNIIQRYIMLSNKYGLSHIVIGTEIDKIADSPGFIEMIEQIRLIYKGSLIYSASFDHFLSADLWQHIDIIGINAYYNLCNNQHCTKSELTESWNYWLTIINNFASGKGKPVFITECGFYSREGCGINPGNWSSGGDASPDEQANSYEALLCQAAAFTNIKGIFWWQWELNNPWNDNTSDYTPKDKPAEDVIKKYWNNY